MGGRIPLLGDDVGTKDSLGMNENTNQDSPGKKKNEARDKKRPRLWPLHK